MSESVPPPDCNRCQHYYITFDARFPYGCRLHGFKTRRRPSLDVSEASGHDCLAFTPRSPGRGRAL